MNTDLHLTLTELVDESAPRLLAIPEDRASEPRAPGKWSCKEIIGHMIDSAVNNQARFVRAQTEDDLVFAGYDQEAWVRVQRYRERPWPDLVQVWRTYNAQIAAIIRATSVPEMERPRARHNLHEVAFGPLPPGSPGSLGFLMRDYIAHLRHHLRQVLDTPPG